MHLVAHREKLATTHEQVRTSGFQKYILPHISHVTKANFAAFIRYLIRTGYLYVVGKADRFNPVFIWPSQRTFRDLKYLRNLAELYKP